jgi:hypothetical protein
MKYGAAVDNGALDITPELRVPLEGLKELFPGWTPFSEENSGIEERFCQAMEAAR